MSYSYGRLKALCRRISRDFIVGRYIKTKKCKAENRVIQTSRTLQEKIN